MYYTRGENDTGCDGDANMYKLVILIEALDSRETFDDEWPEFLHLIEEMPGLRRETASHVEQFLYGEHTYGQMHELFFDSLTDAQKALASSQGSAAGRLLQRMTGGRMTLFIADHKEDDLANIQHYKQNEGQNTQD
jgi:uncharacterized protein (TIGR02118 family)